MKLGKGGKCVSHNRKKVTAFSFSSLLCRVNPNRSFRNIITQLEHDTNIANRSYQIKDPKQDAVKRLVKFGAGVKFQSTMKELKLVVNKDS